MFHVIWFSILAVVLLIASKFGAPPYAIGITLFLGASWCAYAQFLKEIAKRRITGKINIERDCDTRSYEINDESRYTCYTYGRSSASRVALDPTTETGFKELLTVMCSDKEVTSLHIAIAKRLCGIGVQKSNVVETAQALDVGPSEVLYVLNMIHDIKRHYS